MNVFKKYRRKLLGVVNMPLVTDKLPFLLRKQEMENRIINNRESGITNTRYADHEIIVSLTTYGKRLYDVALTIESIMDQTMKANRIVLWLGDEMQTTSLPSSLKRLQDRGLEIAFCKDIRSYKKLVPALCKYPNDAIITIDDDLIYEYDLLEHLIVAYQKCPDYIYCHRAHKISFNKEQLDKYNQWGWEQVSDTPSHYNFPTGCGGVLYPPHSLDSEVTNESVFLDICKYADDVWFKAMALKKGTQVCGVYSHHKGGCDFVENPAVQDVSLNAINVHGESLNDKQIKAVFDKYGLYSRIK